MDLIVDVGNSYIKVAFFRNDILENLKIFSVNRKLQFIDYIKQREYDYAIFSSVKKEDLEVERTVEKLATNFIKLTNDTKLPIKNTYKTPKTLGKDRIALSVGANYLFPRQDVLIIDLGTSITYDFVDRYATYKGGAISEGINTRFRALNLFTDKLPLITDYDIDLEIKLIGQNTREAITSGVLRGVLYEIEGFINDYKKNYPYLRVLFSGGDSKFIYDKIKNQTINLEPNLQLIGLNRIKTYIAFDTKKQ